MRAGIRELCGVAACAIGVTALDTASFADPAEGESPGMGPAQRLGARIDAAAETSWNWVKGRAVEAESRIDAIGGTAQRWWGQAKRSAWGDGASRHAAEVSVAMPLPEGPRDPNARGGSLPLVWRRLGGDTSAVGGERALPLPPRIVLLVHGLDDPGGMWDDLAPALFTRGMTVAKFDYPNDQRIADSTDMLAGVMRGLKSRGVVRVDLVAHSMGGLVVRDLITRPGYYECDASAQSNPAFPRVDRLIILGTPYAGSVFAPLQPVGEAREHLVRRYEGGVRPGDGWLHSYADGDGEAGIDLTPGSDFLKGLDARPLPRNVRITNIIATIVPEGCEQEAASLADAAKRHLGLCDDGAWGKAIAQALGTVGDGVVCFDSAGWACVEDTVRVNADHLSMVQRWQWLDSVGQWWGREPKEPPAIPIIVDRLLNQNAPTPD